MATCADCDCAGLAGMACANIMCREHCMEYGYFKCNQKSHDHVGNDARMILQRTRQGSRQGSRQGTRQGSRQNQEQEDK